MHKVSKEGRINRIYVAGQIETAMIYKNQCRLNFEFFKEQRKDVNQLSESPPMSPPPARKQVGIIMADNISSY